MAGVTNGIVTTPLLLHSKEFKNVDEMPEFPFYNRMCPLVVLVHFSDVSLQTKSMSRTHSNLKESRYLGQDSGLCMGVCPGGVTGDHMCIDNIISSSSACVSVGTVFITQQNALIPIPKTDAT